MLWRVRHAGIMDSEPQLPPAAVTRRGWTGRDSEAGGGQATTVWYLAKGNWNGLK